MSEDPWTVEATIAFNEALAETLYGLLNEARLMKARADCEIEAVDIESVLSVAPVVEEKQKPRSRSL